MKNTKKDIVYATIAPYFKHEKREEKKNLCKILFKLRLNSIKNKKKRFFNKENQNFRKIVHKFRFVTDIRQKNNDFWNQIFKNSRT